MRINIVEFYLLLIVCFVLSGCGANKAPEYLETIHQIPQEIWDTLDRGTQEALAEGTKYVALTFDDGPRCETTSLLLDGLAQRGAQATFFVVGTQVVCAENETLLIRMKDEGHQVGNHTYSHVRLHAADKDIVLEEIHKNDVILRNILGEGDYWLRPPYGLIDGSTAKLVKTPMIYWSLDPEDWKLLDAEKVRDHVVNHVKDGDIILLHDFYPSSVEAALMIVDQLQLEGYTFVTVEELFRIKGVEPENGILYASPTVIRPGC